MPHEKRRGADSMGIGDEAQVSPARFSAKFIIAATRCDDSFIDREQILRHAAHFARAFRRGGVLAPTASSSKNHRQYEVDAHRSSDL